MDLSLPLATVAPSLDAEVLTVLARTTAPLSGRRVGALARRGSHQGVQRVLNRLVEHGLVLAEPASPAILYRLNRDHVLAEPLQRMVTAGETLESRIRDAIEGWSVQPIHASVFGSFARGAAGPSSDIDVLVVRPESVDADAAAWQQQLAELEERVHAWSGNTLSWFETTQSGLDRAIASQEPIIESWRDDAVHLAGVRLSSLTRGVSA
jgi:predicted nucleotidyltransferase